MFSQYPKEDDYLPTEEVTGLFEKQQAKLKTRFAAMANLAQSPCVHTLFAYFGIPTHLCGYRLLCRTLELNTQIAPDAVGRCTYVSILRSLSAETGRKVKQIDRNLTYLLDAAAKNRRFSNYLTYVKSFDGRLPASITPAFFLNTVRFLLYKQILTGCFDFLFDLPLPARRPKISYVKRVTNSDLCGKI